MTNYIDGFDKGGILTEEIRFITIQGSKSCKKNS